MNIEKVRDHLKRTIAGKEAMLNTLNSRRVIDKVAIKYLEININELERILKDVQSCISTQEQLEEQGWQG